MYKKKGIGAIWKWFALFLGQCVDDLKAQLENKMDIPFLHLVEDLEEEHSGLVTFASGKSRFLIPVFNYI